MKITEPNASRTSRRHFLRGAGVALALPWMESLPLFARKAQAPQQGCFEQAADALRHPLLLQRRRAHSLVGEGQRRYRWNSARCWSRWRRIARTSSFLRGSVQPAGRCIAPVRTSAACRTCCRAQRSASIPPTFASAPHSIRCWRSRSAIRPPCRAWRWASSRTNSGSKTACR